MQAVVEQSEEPEEVETRTPLTNSYKSSTDKEFIIGVSIVGGVILTLALLITFACLFDWPWAFWQWFIGIVGGTVLFAILGGLVWALDSGDVVDYFIFGTIVLGICVVLNFVLFLKFRDDYQIMFYWFSLFEFIGGIILSNATFDIIEEEWGGVQVLEMIMIVIFLCVKWIWL